MIYVENKKRKLEKLKAEYPGAVIVDITSQAKDDLVKLSPFYPHGDIPVPFSPGVTAACVEAVWQGLKVFQTVDVDTAVFSCTTMKNIKRTVRKNGVPLGHRKGVSGTELLGYFEARVQIYLPTYKWMLENKVPRILARLSEAAKMKDIVLLDYNTNGDVCDLSKPLSHAALVKAFVEGRYPDGKTVSAKSPEPLKRPDAGGTPRKMRRKKKVEKKVPEVNDEQLSMF